MRQSRLLKVKVSLEGEILQPVFYVHSIALVYFEKVFMKLCHTEGQKFEPFCSCQLHIS